MTTAALNAQPVTQATTARAPTAIHYIIGDATRPVGEGARLIAHICNDAGAWGKGFKLALSQRWDAPKQAYRSWDMNRSSNDSQLGQIQVVDVGESIAVVNMLAQRWIAPIDNVPPIRYDALRSCLGHLAQQALARNASVHMPRIGSGQGGGQWSQVEPLLQQTLAAAGIEVFVYDLPSDSAPTA